MANGKEEKEAGKIRLPMGYVFGPDFLCHLLHYDK